MALSNWDTLAVDLDGKPTDGRFVSPSGVVVSFYKNWLYIEDKKAWRKKGGYSKPVIMEVHSGELQYMDVKISAIRGPQEGVYAVVTSGWSHDNTLKGMIGCGVSGYEEADLNNDPDAEIKWVGVKKESLKFLQDWISEKKYNLEEARQWLLDLGWKSALEEDPSRQEQFDKEVKDIMSWTEFDKEIASVDLSAATRFNQGDAYFMGKIGLENEEVATKTGEAEPTIMSQAIKGMKNSSDEKD